MKSVRPAWISCRRLMVAEAAETEQLHEDMASGRTDVLEWLRAQSDYALVPPGAIYQAECSRVVTAEGAGVTAALTLALNEFYRRRGEEETGVRSAAAQGIQEMTAQAGVLPRNILPPCAALPTGPMVEISFDRGTAEQASDPEYERVREALFLAQADAANPSAIEIEIPPDAPPEVKAEMQTIRAEFAVRRANLAVYRRHEARLAPLLDALAGPAEP